jgi:hypothetical protein
MAKPICIIYFPENMQPANGRVDWIFDFARFLNGEQCSGEKWKQENYFKDYYWFCFYKHDIAAPEFKVFYEKNFIEIQYQELKEIITKSINDSNDKRTTLP